MSAFHEINKTCTIPKRIDRLVYKMAGLDFVDSTVMRANINTAENFSPTAIALMKKEVETKLNKYKTIKLNKC